MPYCLRRNPPASFCSNSASFKLPAPKSTAKNDFEFNIEFAYATRDQIAYCRFQWLRSSFQKVRASYCKSVKRSIVLIKKLCP